MVNASCQKMLPPDRTHAIDEIRQLRAVSNELRQLLLASFCGEPITTKQLAKKIAQPPTKLYHHVASLEAAGLIRLVESRPNRGTTEHYYQAVARAFRIGDRLLGEASSTSGDQRLGPAESGAGAGGQQPEVLFEQTLQLNDQELRLFHEQLSEFVSLYSGPASPGAKAATVALIRPAASRG